MAGRGFTLDAASHRVIVVRLTAADIKDATHHRLASALQLALWATPAARTCRIGISEVPGAAS